jgi:hypothetical protein
LRLKSSDEVDDCKPLLYGPDKVSQFGVLDMREATAMACEMVMMHGWSDLGPLCVLQDSSNEEKYLKASTHKGQASMGDGRIRGKMLGIGPGRVATDQSDITSGGAVQVESS